MKTTLKIIIALAGLILILTTGFMLVGILGGVNLTTFARNRGVEPDEFHSLLLNTITLSAYLLVFASATLAMLSGIGWMAIRSIKQHALSTTVTAGSVALACGLLMAVFGIKTQTFNAFTGSSGGFDAVLGARGAQLQLVLNSIYHLETSTGNLPFEVYKEIRDDPRIERAIPLTVGDNYKGFRMVGTTLEMFTDHEYAPGEKFKVEEGGEFFDPEYPDAVVGSFVAQQLGLKVGDEINTYHGLSYTGEASAHDDKFLIKGILEPTNTPADRAIWIPYEAYYWMGGHALYGSGEKYVPKGGVKIPDEHKEVSAVLLKFKTRGAGFRLSQQINSQGNVATLAWPIGNVMATLFDKVAWVNRVLELVAYLIMVVAAGSILASIYNSMNERRREFAILRALGAKRMTVFGAIVIESGTIALLGTLLAYLVYAILFSIASSIIRQQTGIVLDLTAYHPVLILTPPAMIIIGAVSGIIPAYKAYRTDVATNIVPSS